MKILVTGASGYIGSKLADRLLAQNHTVYSLYHSTTIKENVKYILLENLYSHDFDLIFHLAAFPDKHNTETENVIDTIENNILLSTKLLCYSRDKKIHIISASSYSQYIDSTPYAISKATVEKLAESIGVPKYSFARFTDTYGEDDKRAKVYNLIKRAVEDNVVIRLQKPSNFEINFTHVDDIVDALIYIAEYKHYGIFDLIYEETITTMQKMATAVDPSAKHFEFTSDEVVKYNVPTDKNRLPGFKLKKGNCFA